MPIYEFICSKCGQEFEKLSGSSQSVKCPHCGSGETRKLMSACARRPRGTGEYAASGTSGCGGCSGGNCSSCGR